MFNWSGKSGLISILMLLLNRELEFFLLLFECLPLFRSFGEDRKVALDLRALSRRAS